jgi:hypothetical protein
MHVWKNMLVRILKHGRNGNASGDWLRSPISQCCYCFTEVILNVLVKTVCQKIEHIMVYIFYKTSKKMEYFCSQDLSQPYNMDHKPIPDLWTEEKSLAHRKIILFEIEENNNFKTSYQRLWSCYILRYRYRKYLVNKSSWGLHTWTDIGNIWFSFYLSRIQNS